MYKKQEFTQISFEDFNQPIGLHMDPENRWIKKAELIPWSILENDYAKLFKNNKGNIAKSFRMAFGSLLIQTKLMCSDEETVAQIQENPYLQYFIGLPGFQLEKPFDASTMVYFRNRLSSDKLAEINEVIIQYNEQESSHDKSDPPTGGSGENKGTLMMDATCAPSNIKYPQDVELLNDARVKTEELIDEVCQTFKLKKPRTDRKDARKNYLAFSRLKKRTVKKRRKAIKQQLKYVERNIRHLNRMQTLGAELDERQQKSFRIITEIAKQQRDMYDHQTHRVNDRIVSFSQPYLRPIVRGKIKAPTEFGVKLDISQSAGFVQVERISFDAFNESKDFQIIVERYNERTGHYPERVLADQIYRTRENRAYCKKHHIRLSGPKLGRPSKNEEDQAIRWKDERDRIQIERELSLAKRCHGLGLIRTKLAETTLTAVNLAIVSLNLSKIQRNIFDWFLEWFLKPALIIDC